MRVALVCERFDPNGGGLEQWVHAFASRIRQRGHTIRIVTFHAGGGSADARPGRHDDPASPERSCQLDGLSVHVVRWSDSRRERARLAEATVARLDVDVVHDTGVGCRCDVLHPQGGSRLVNEERTQASRTWPERIRRRLRPSFWRWRAEWRAHECRMYARHAGLVIAGARRVMRDLHERHAVGIDRFRLVPNGVDVERFSPEACAAHRGRLRLQLGLSDETVFLFAAHNPRLKGLRPLLRACAVVREVNPGVRLLVIGRSPDRQTRRMVARLQLEAAAIFAGFVEDQLPYYAAADVFVLPTYYDACSLTVVEAAACGLPVITTRDNGASELMTHAHDGFVVPSADDIDALAGVMIEVAKPEVRRRMSGPARALAERHTLDDAVRMIERVYEEVRQRAPVGTIA
jgi:UDP-glucose:(heptosyl)LPS alpha-1,3-glucosyltransferase